MASGISPHDTAVWHTCQLNELIDVGQLSTWPFIPATFAPQFAADERVLAVGTFELSEFGAVGDGSYTHDSGMFFATGRGGLTITAAAAAARAIGNSSRRNAARADAAPRWYVIDQGQISVTSHGFYLMSPQGLFPWAYTDLSAVQLNGPGLLWFTGQSQNGPVSWVLATDWAELLFTLWARVCHPQHPQFYGGVWVPPGWRDRLTAAGVAPPRALTAASPLIGILGS